MRKWLKYILLPLIPIIIGLLYGFAQSKHNARRIQTMTINFVGEDTGMTTKEAVSNLLIQNTGDPLNQLNSTINLHAIEDQVKKNPMVKNAEIYLSPKGQLFIDIKQKKPIARLTTKKGHQYMDENGKLMPVSPYHSARVMLLEGVNTSIEQEAAFKIIDYIKHDDFYAKQVVGIKRLNNGDFLIDTRIGRHQILFGKAENIDVKFNKLKIFYKRMWHEDQLKKYKLLNIKYNKQVVCS
ncbi:MAG: hypothetical protein CR968_05605 [Flavobacteriia bacterium]|nr:MAG: hypothetical protein CR968_05605 [Flavobacteriia bacterium]